MQAPHPLLVALNRFGLGGRAAAAVYLAGASGDPRGFVKAELEAGKVMDLPGKPLQPSAKLLQALYLEQQALKEARAAAPPPAAMDPNAPKPPPPPNVAQDTYRDEALARFQQSVRVPCGILERLSAFWANHFAVSAFKSPFVRITAGAFEREAIRPFILGRFADMVRAVEQHPTMLHYLDNEFSAGPQSQVVRNNPKRGLNENLAREIMELHTLGVNGGYSQTDVTTLAKIITGWTYAGPDGRIAAPGQFGFMAPWHEPGPQTLLGRVFDQPGLQQGAAALDMLATHPATAKFIATKLVRHFVADDPPPALVERLAKIFRDTGGDLGSVTRALLAADEAWTLPLTKMRSPRDFILATLRLIGRAPEEPNRTLGGLNLLGEPLWSPSGPNGFPDTNGAWGAPEQLKLRLDIASQVAQQLRDPPNPKDLLEETFGPAASETTRDAVARAESKQQGFALLLMSPEMQRR